MPRVVLRYAVESDIETRVVTDARKRYGIIGLKLTPRGRRHYADRLWFLPAGRVLLIEFKRPGDSPRTSQMNVHKTLALLGHTVYVVDDYDIGMGVIARAVEAARRAAKGRQVPS